MDRLIQWIQANPIFGAWVTLISLFAAIITALAFIIQLRDRKKKTVVYTTDSTVLINEKLLNIDALKVLYNGNEIKSLVITKLTIRNGGNEALEERDFHDGFGLCINIPTGDTLLAVSVVKQSELCRFKVKPYSHNNVVNLSFYYMEPKDYVVINIYHTSNSEVTLGGRIKGGKIKDVSLETTLLTSLDIALEISGMNSALVRRMLHRR